MLTHLSPHALHSLANWLARHNPLYLISAMLMALGARLYLTDPTTIPGEVHLLVVTLTVLQVYEWAVGILLFLLRRGKSGVDDETSLLIVGALFWTGPMAATIEMTVIDPLAGAMLAGVVASISLLELGLGRKLIVPTLTMNTLWQGALFLALLVVCPITLRMNTGADGRHELFLYYSWWVLSGVICITGMPRLSGMEIGFALLVSVASGIHFVGMNYAFDCHASWSYLAPVLPAIAFFFTRGGLSIPWLRRHASWVVAGTTVLALFLSLWPMSSRIPISLFPAGLRAPILPVSLFSAVVCYYGFLKMRRSLVLHTGTLSLAAFLFVVSNPASFTPTGPIGLPNRISLWILLYFSASYLLMFAWIRRSRMEAIVALILHALGLTLLLWHGDGRVIWFQHLVWGCSLLGVAHLTESRQPLIVRLIPVSILLCAAWTARHSWVGSCILVCLILLLIVWGCWQRWTQYHWVGATIGLSAGLLAISRSPLAGAHLAVITSFGLLGLGGLISLRKRQWLESPAPFSIREQGNPLSVQSAEETTAPKLPND